MGCIRIIQEEQIAGFTDMANSNNWGEIYKSTWWGDEEWSANSLFIDSAPAGFGFTGLLDEFSGAAAAYSVRKLSSTYEGNCIRVRKQVASSPVHEDIGFVNNELDSAALLAFAADADNGDVFVVTWYDQSGNDNDATQSTAASQPKIVDAGSVVEENGKPAINTQTDDYFTASSLVTGTSARSIILIGRTDSAVSSNNGMVDLNAVSGSSGELYNLTSEIATRVSGFALYNDDYQNSTPLLLEQYFAAGGDVIDIDTYLNTTLLTISSSSNATLNTSSGSTRINKLSYASGISGYYQELIIYASDQSANRTGIEGNINDFYSIY